MLFPNEEYLGDLFSVGPLNKEFVHSNQLINTITLIDKDRFFFFYSWWWYYRLWCMDQTSVRISLFRASFIQVAWQKQTRMGTATLSLHVFVSYTVASVCRSCVTPSVALRPAWWRLTAGGSRSSTASSPRLWLTLEASTRSRSASTRRKSRRPTTPR